MGHYIYAMTSVDKIMCAACADSKACNSFVVVEAFDNAKF